MNEFQETLEKLNACIATIQGECTITLDEGLYAESIYYRCRDYMKAYVEHKYWETRYRCKE